MMCLENNTPTHNDEQVSVSWRQYWFNIIEFIDSINVHVLKVLQHIAGFAHDIFSYFLELFSCRFDTFY